MTEIRDILPNDVLHDVHDRLFDVLYENGADLLTDKDREALGLEARDAKGWTASERVQAHRDFLDALLMVSRYSYESKSVLDAQE